jgi:hypothetical protein
MAEKSKTQRTEHAAEEQMGDMADKARRQYEHAVRTGQKLGEEAGQWWTKILSQTTTAADWQKNFTNIASMTNRMIPLAQRRMEEAMELMEKNSRTSAELVKKAVDAVQTPQLAECQAKWLDFCTSSMKATQGNLEAVAEMSTKAIDSWIHLVQTNSETAEFRAHKAV